MIRSEAVRHSVSRRFRMISGVLATLLVGAMLVTAPPAVAVDLRPVTVTILRITGPNPDLDTIAPGDYYVAAKIGDHPFQENSAAETSSSDFTPFWTFTRNVDADLGTEIPITIELWDQDFGFDDEIDINPIDGKTDVDLVLDLDTGLWTGDAPGQEFGFASGDGDLEHFVELYKGTEGTLLFDISVSDGDADDDGIPDGVERFGIRDESGNQVTDMAAMGADPCRKNIAVEIDWHETPTHSHRPSDAAMAEVLAAFDSAPVPAVANCPYPGFPTETSGIGLLLDLDSAIDLTDALDATGPFDLAELAQAKKDNAHPARDPYFHYNVWVHTMDGTNVSGRCCSESSDFITSLGLWDPAPNGTDRDQAGTFMHEFGHSLGLGHGGADKINHKPNYLSVMSYRFQTVGIPDADLLASFGWDDALLEAAATVDYSRAALPDLDETGLSEPAGIGDASALTAWRDPTLTVQTGRGDGGLDWDFDAGGGPPFEAGPVTVDVNFNREEACVSVGDNGALDTAPAGDDFTRSSRIYTGADRTCDTSASGDDTQTNAVGWMQPAVLPGASDWDNLQFQAALSPFFGLGTGDEHREISFDEAQEIETEWRNAVNVCGIPSPQPPGAIIVPQPGGFTAGTPGPDVIYGTDGDDRIAGLGGNDIVFGGGGNDQLTGGEGDDTLCGGPGADALSGDEGADLLSGDLDGDRLTGGAGDDRLVGGAGADRLSASSGDDTCTPGGQPGDVAVPAPDCDTVN